MKKKCRYKLSIKPKNASQILITDGSREIQPHLVDEILAKSTDIVRETRKTVKSKHEVTDFFSKNVRSHGLESRKN